MTNLTYQPTKHSKNSWQTFVKVLSGLNSYFLVNVALLFVNANVGKWLFLFKVTSRNFDISGSATFFNFISALPLFNKSAKNPLRAYLQALSDARLANHCGFWLSRLTRDFFWKTKATVTFVFPSTSVMFGCYLTGFPAKTCWCSSGRLSRRVRRAYWREVPWSELVEFIILSWFPLWYWLFPVELPGPRFVAWSNLRRCKKKMRYLE